MILAGMRQLMLGANFSDIQTRKTAYVIRLFSHHNVMRDLNACSNNTSVLYQRPYHSTFTVDYSHFIQYPCQSHSTFVIRLIIFTIYILT